MLNACNLAIVSMMSLGMATSSMPNFDNPKNKTTLTQNANNITTNYNLTLDLVNRSSQDYNNVSVDTNITGQVYERRINYQKNSAYLNIISSLYESYSYRILNDLERDYIENYEKYQVDNEIYEVSTQLLLVMEITPYNYNVETQANINIDFDVSGWTTNQGEQIRLDHKYMLKNVYQTTQDDWSTYLNMQVALRNAYNIYTDIENVNNNFYYTKNTSVNEITANNYTDVTHINITPKVNNYFVFQYVPLVKCSAKESGQDWEDFGTIVKTIPLTNNANISPQSIAISGTNVIPDGTQEVIDLPGLMWQILAMPFAFVSQAFNLTLFPGTPYQINISNLFLSIIAIMVFIWLITFFLRIKG